MEKPIGLPSPPSNSVPANGPGDERRGFLAKLGAVVIGGLVTVVPLVAGLCTFFDPLRRKTAGAGEFLKIAPLESLTPGGAPQRFQVIADRVDAWNTFPKDPIGAVYLRLLPDGKTVEAFNVVCPHAGCPIGYSADEHLFKCPCHTSDFNLDGSVVAGPSPRGMDQLQCEVRDEQGLTQVLVKFVNYYPGKEEQVVRP